MDDIANASYTYDTVYEQLTVSPSVLQITTDYLFVRRKLQDDGAVLETDMGQDIALSIVCDAYAHDAESKKVQFVRVHSISDPEGNECGND